MQDQKTILTTDDCMLNAVLDALAARQDHPEFAFGIGAFEHPPLGRDLGADPDHEVLLAARGTHADPIPLVRLVEDLGVVLFGGAQLVPPDCVGPPGVVDRQIEDV